MKEYHVEFSVIVTANNKKEAEKIAVNYLYKRKNRMNHVSHIGEY